MSGTGVSDAIASASTDQLQQLKDKLEKEIHARKELEKLSKQIEMTITPEGLRIELIEGKNGTFFQSGSAELSPSGQELLSLLAAELKNAAQFTADRGPHRRHALSQHFGLQQLDLSADRANSARRLMQQDGVRSNQVTQVRGYADQMLRVKSDPFDPSNRRISILVKNDNETVPTLLAANVVNGSTPLPGAHEGGRRGKEWSQSKGRDAIRSARRQARHSRRIPGRASQARDRCACRPTGLDGKLKAMLPGSKN